jgi:DNA polymerase I-like protein with 3'-5' exonuclease and polymerase domains
LKIVFADIETNGLNPTKVHCIAIKTIDGNFKHTFTDMNAFAVWVEYYKPDKWVFHNGLGFDVWWINKLVKPLINPLSVVDTMVVSKLVNYTRFSTHSLKELGQHLGVYKGDYEGGWDECNEDMLEYCTQDVEVLEAVFNMYRPQIMDKAWVEAMRVEHDMAIICHDMSQNGFLFDIPEAQKMLMEIDAEMEVLEKSFQEAFPPKLEEVNRIKYRTKKDGELFSSVTNAMEKYPLTKVEGGELICYDYITFNPGSSKQRIDVLWDAGWKPTKMTKGHKKFLRESK